VKRKNLLKLIVGASLAVVLVISVPLMSGCAAPAPTPTPEPTPTPTPGPEEPVPAGEVPEGLSVDEVGVLGQLHDQQIGVTYPIGETINVGFLAALSGPDAGWGLPGLCGNNIWIDAVNKCGGLLVGGTRYPLKMWEFDDETVGSKALQGARELVLEHDVKFINAIGGNCADATHPFLSDHGVVYASLVPTDCRPDRPYLVAGGDITPQCNMLNLRLASMVLPTQKELGRPWTYAVTTQDCIMSRMNGGWEVGAAIATGFDVVYEEFFPCEQTDFAPVITDIMASNPDVISLCEAWPTFQTLMWEQLYLQGYEGVVIQNYADWEANLQKVPPEYVAARYGIDSFPLMDDPWWGDPSWQASFTRAWNARYGPGAPEDVHRHMTGIDWDHVVWLMPWCIGAQQWGIDHPGEGFPNNDQILETLRAMDSFATCLGPGHMSGMEMLGIDNMIEQPVPMCMFNLEAGDKRIVAQYNFEPWFQAQKDVMIGAVEDRGMMYYQR